MGRFYEAGAELIVLGKDPSHLEALEKSFPGVRTIQADLRNWEETREAVKSVLPIHHLVNNAGVPAPFPCLQITEEQIDS